MKSRDNLPAHLIEPRVSQEAWWNEGGVSIEINKRNSYDRNKTCPYYARAVGLTRYH